MGLVVGSVRTQATVRLSLFPVVGAFEVCRANLRLHARGFGRTARHREAVQVSILAIEESLGQQWLTPETQLTLVRIEMPNCRPAVLAFGKG